MFGSNSKAWAKTIQLKKQIYMSFYEHAKSFLPKKRLSFKNLQKIEN